LYDWLSLLGEAKFGLPARFEDFSPLLFVAPLFALVGGILALVWTLPLEKANFASKTGHTASSDGPTETKVNFLAGFANSFVWYRIFLRDLVPRSPSVSLSRTYAHNYLIGADRSS